MFSLPLVAIHVCFGLIRITLIGWFGVKHQVSACLPACLSVCLGEGNSLSVLPVCMRTNVFYIIIVFNLDNASRDSNFHETLINKVALYCIVLHCIVFYCTVLYCTVLYCIVFYCTVLSCLVLPCLALPCLALYCIVLYCIVLYWIALYCIVLHCPKEDGSTSSTYHHY